MKTFKRLLRLLVLTLMIALASVLPVPITFYKKDDLPKFLIEQVDNKEEEEEKKDTKEIF